MKLPEIDLPDLQLLAVAAGTRSTLVYVLAIVIFGLVRASRSWAPAVSAIVEHREATKQMDIIERSATERRRIDVEVLLILHERAELPTGDPNSTAITQLASADPP